MEKYTVKITDQTGDKKYFTTIPNYILDHCEAIEGIIYAHIKRVAGEHGSFYMGKRAMKKRFGLGHKSIKISLDSLQEKELIKLLPEPKKIRGQNVKEYVITDVWRKNMVYYQDKTEGVPESDHLAVPQRDHLSKRCSPKDQKGGRFGALKKNNTKEEHITMNKEELKIARREAGECVNQANDINEVIGMFAKVNPGMFKNWYKQKTQRQAIDRMIDAYSLEQVKRVVAFLSISNRTPYFPIIDEPIELERKYSKLASAWYRKKVESVKNKKQIII